MLDQILSILQGADSVVITTHTRPDGDAIGSQLALGLFLDGKGKQVRLINQDPIPYSLEWMPQVDRVERFDGSLSQLEAIAGADALVVVDTNTEDRLGDLGPSFVGGNGAKILLDHHTEPEKWFDAALTLEHASSTGEIVYGLISAWDEAAVSHAIATALYVAVMTDTGSFRFSNVTGNVHRIMGDLIDRGNLDTAAIHASIYDVRSPEGIQLLSRVLATLRLHHEGEVGSMVISRRALAETGANIEEADGFVNQILTIEGVRVALLFTETERGTKVSLRSKGDAHVHIWARALGGGGHRNAAGAFLKKGLDETIALVVKKAPDFIQLRGQGQHQLQDHNHNSDSSEDAALGAEDAEYLSSLLKMQPRGSVG